MAGPNPWVQLIGKLEEGDAQNLENRVQAGRQVEPLLDDGDEHVHRNGDPELGLHGVLGGAVRP